MKGDETDTRAFCLAIPLALNPTNSPVTDRQSASRIKCSGRIVLPISAEAHLKFCTEGAISIYSVDNYTDAAMKKIQIF